MEQHVIYLNGKFWIKNPESGKLSPISILGTGGSRRTINNITSGGGFDLWFQAGEFVIDNGGLENTFYYPIVRNAPPGTVDSSQTIRYKYKGGVNVTLSRLAVFASANGAITNPLVITLMKNGVATALTVTIPINVPVGGSMYIDTTNSVNIVDGDEISLRAEFVEGDQSPFNIYYTQIKVVQS